MAWADGMAMMRCVGLAVVSRVVILATLLVAAPVPSRAASFTIDPLKIVLSEGQASTVIRVQNTGKDTLTLQLQPRRWRQEARADRLEPTRELVATPQIFRIKPGSTQLVRIAMLGKPDPERESAYRLVFDEIPAPPASDFIGVQVAMQITIPLFISPLKKSTSEVKLAVMESGANKLLIVAENQGNAHAHLKKFIVARHGDDTVAPVEIEMPAYLLPGVTREFQVPRPLWMLESSEKVSIRAIGVTGTVEFDGLVPR
jgi:fimbrial chaperone protein